MAHLTARRPQNVEGDLYVDSSCIDCDTCRWMVPDVFTREAGQSAVVHQPETAAERLAALQALLACPTASIGTVEPPKGMKAAQASFPIPVTDNIYHCGYHSEKSYGAASYFIQRPEGNVLVDSPRFAAPLVKQLEALGGVRYLYLTHQDDVADHQQFHDRFGCDRILHVDDIGSSTASVEIQIQGTDSVELALDLTIIPVPGHTKGHTVLLYDNRVLFTGDHLAWSVRLHQLHAFRSVCWYSWPEQIKSMERLAAYDFEWVLPGHGRRHHADKATMHQHMQKCLDWMKAQ
ncbi:MULTISPECIES: MBL fold metallo-hydrolase [Cyanophyceae]|uniref:MBL fold metallo-hydrolase n=1 Tax=Leptolyngbya subtilissima DQ-A4 TaxID=2933933 RepID=A0ABV0K622_9CYAN|nr:MBL fold metallo-hydrolase [Nodosilinea sp. FACHB-141]MBD2114318.1 MBL fold metallo-hydrolase [Nodosilinea sp. FACHB-141]